MYDLFNAPPGDGDLSLNSSNNAVPKIDGLTYLSAFLTQDEEKHLIEAINSEEWLNDLKRRVQHYGYKYDYKARAINYRMYIGDLPHWAKPLAIKLWERGHISEIPDQLIINEYKPGQGIANHVDCEPCFGDTVISISLGSTCVMDFINLQTKEKREVFLEKGSLVSIQGEARYKWTHGIPQRKTDVVNGIKIERALRISMTFRKVILK